MFYTKDLTHEIWQKAKLVVILALLMAGKQPAFGAPHGSSGKISLSGVYAQLPLSFALNRGQTDGRVKFVARGQGYNLFLTSTEAVLTLHLRAGALNRSRSEARQQVELESQSAVLRIQFVGANPEPKMSGLDKLPGKINYFIGKQPQHWLTNVPNYARVKYQEVFPGVDLIYYGSQGQLEYDFVIAPGGDTRAVRLKLAGVDNLAVDPRGNLVIQIGGAELLMNKPLIYQVVHGAKTRVNGEYVILDSDQVGFQVAAHDSSRPLVIDPVLAHSTYLGGVRDDFGNSIAVDSSGNSYVTGTTLSFDFPTEIPLQGSRAGLRDVFVAKLNSAGDMLEYSTYLGGSNDDFGNSIAIDSSGNSYVTGTTLSDDFPTEIPLQDVRGGLRDVFVTKLNSTGDMLLYSTYLGGASDDDGNSVAVDNSGSSHVTGLTRSADFPTKDPLQLKASVEDGFVSKLNSAGDSLVFSTYLGGSSDDVGNSIAVDSSGNSYVAGSTTSSDFPLEKPYQAFRAGFSDVFVTQLNSVGDALVYSTYLGGSRDDFGRGIVVDDNGDGYVTGSTFSDDFPIKDPFQASRAGFSDVFISKLNSAGDALLYSTYLGGSSDDVGNSIAVDSSGNSYVAGDTVSNDFPIKNAFQGLRSDLSDVFVSKLEEQGPPGPTPPPDGEEECCDINCFIATAAFGSPLEPKVQLLREFRDRFLLDSVFGRKLVRIYSIYSPIAAEFIGNHRTARSVVRWGLLPLVGVSWMALKLGLTTTLMTLGLSMLVISFLTVVWYRKYRA